MLSSEFWRNFLPAGEDFTIPAPIFLPVGIPFLELPKQGQSVRRFPRFMEVLGFVEVLVDELSVAKVS
jgi:hypothetical protein